MSEKVTHKLFEYVVIRHTPKGSEIIVPVTAVAAKDQASATLLAARAIPDEHVADLENLEVAVRPF